MSHNIGSDTTCHTSVWKEVNRSFHTCAQDVQITRTTISKEIVHNVMIIAISEYISYKMTPGSKKITEQAAL
jgi:hypothetical protein